MTPKDPQEPTFTIRAKDVLAVPTVRAYLRECEDHGFKFQAAQVELALVELVEWQEDHDVKVPKHEHVPHPMSRKVRDEEVKKKRAEEERERETA